MNYLKNRQKLYTGISDQSVGFLISSIFNRNYYYGFKSSFGIGLILFDKAYYFTDNRYYEMACSALMTKGNNVEVISSTSENYLSLLNDILIKYQIDKLYFEDERITYSDFFSFKERLIDRLQFIPASYLIDSFRIVKDKFEIDCIIKAQNITDKAFKNILNFIKPGISEKDIKNELHFQMFSLGAEDIAFDTIIASGNNSSKPHATVSDRVIQNGDFITLDFGAKYNSYCSDMTRTIAVGNITQDMKNIYNCVLNAQRVALEVLQSNNGDIAFKEVVNYFDSKGYKDNFLHGLGHGLGLEIHEAPYLNSRTLKKPAVSSVVSVEPGLYFNGNYGVRIEDIVVINNNGITNLTKSDKSLIIL